MKLSFAAASIRRPVTVCMLTLCMTCLGYIAWTRLPLQFLPEVSAPFINVRIAYPGASPAQVEKEVAVPAEGEFRTIRGLLNIRTISDANGCFVNMIFDLDTDMTMATADVRDRMERLKLVFPKAVDKMMIERFNSRSIPIVAAGLFRESDEEEFVHLVRTLAEPRIRRVPGVADVQVLTTKPEKEVLIEFDQDLLRSLNLGLYELVGALQLSSLNVSVGELDQSQKTYIARVMGEYRNIDDLQNIIVSPNGLRLKDIANVRYAARETNTNVSIDKKGGAFLLVIKDAEANTVAACQGVRDELEKIKQDYMFKGAESFIFFDQSALIQRALSNLIQAGIYGAAMSLAILFLFIYRVRPTLIVMVCLPAALMVALVVMFFWGMSLNIVSMVAMIIAVGNLVDNAIVVIENIVMRRQRGAGSVESAMGAAEEMWLAIAASTATNLVVFVPMFYMKAGRMSVFMRELAVPIVTSMAASLVIAVTLVPLAMSHIHDRQPGQPGLLSGPRVGNVVRRVSGLFKWVASLYMRVGLLSKVIEAYCWTVEKAVRNRVIATIVIAGILAVTYFVPFQYVGNQDEPRLDTREVKINVATDQSMDVADIRALLDSMYTELDKMREELGIKHIFSLQFPRRGEIGLYLYTSDDDPKWDDPKYSTEDVLRIVSEKMPAAVPGAELTFSMTDEGSSGQDQYVSLQIRGDDAATLQEYADVVKQRMSAVPTLVEVHTDVQRSQEEVQLMIDESLSQRLGIAPIMVAQTVDVALRGTRMPPMKQGGREVPVWAQFREEDRQSRANLDNVAVTSPVGGLVPLKQLVDYGRSMTPSAIQRYNGKNVVSISAHTTEKDLTGIREALRNIVQTTELPQGYSFSFGDKLDELAQNMVNFSASLIMAIILVYLVMAAVFESYLLPLSILTTVPLSFVGVYWMLYLTSSQLDIITLIGCIMMVGIIVNNGIVIVDHINQMRGQIPRDVAVVQATRDRFNAVMMTALTSVLGCVPLALAKSGGAVAFVGLGRAMIGGMITGTLLTLVIVPLVYTMIDDFAQWTIDYINDLLSLRRKGKEGRAKAVPQFE